MHSAKIISPKCRKKIWRGRNTFPDENNIQSTEIAIHILAITRNVLAHNLIKDNILCAAYRYKHVVQ